MDKKRPPIELNAHWIKRDGLTVKELRRLLDSLMIVEMTCFPWKPDEYDHIKSYYLGMLVDPDNIMVILKYSEKMIGYAIAEPHNNEYCDEMLKADPKFRKIDNAYYIESVAVLPEYRHMGGFKKMTSLLYGDIRRHGGNMVTGHVRMIDGFDKVVAPYVKYQVDKWKFLHGKESMKYFEMPI